MHFSLSISFHTKGTSIWASWYSVPPGSGTLKLSTRTELHVLCTPPQLEARLTVHPNGLQQQLVEWCTTVENTTYMCAKPSVRNLTNAKSLLGLTKETVCVLSSFFSIVGSVETQPEHTYRGMVAYRLVLRHSGTVSSLLNQYVKTISSRSIPLVYNLHIRSAVGEVMAVPKLPRFVFEQSKRKVHCISCKKNLLNLQLCKTNYDVENTTLSCLCMFPDPFPEGRTGCWDNKNFCYLKLWQWLLEWVTVMEYYNRLENLYWAGTVSWWIHHHSYAPGVPNSQDRLPWWPSSFQHEKGKFKVLVFKLA